MKQPGRAFSFFTEKPQVYEQMYDNDTPLGDVISAMNDRFVAMGYGDGDAFPCPCCHRRVAKNRRDVYNRNAADLIRLYRLGPGFHHKRDFAATKTGGGDFAKMRWWDLVVQAEHDPADATKKTSGFWRMTKRGVDFVTQKIRIDQYIYIFDKKPYTGPKLPKGRQVSIRDCLGKSFSFDELMAGPGSEWHPDAPDEDPHPSCLF